MRKKIYDLLNAVYSVTMFVSFFSGLLPIIPFVLALCIGGKIGENISIFLYKQYYPYVIALASLSIVIGLVAMYIGGKQALSVKKVSVEDKNR